MALIRKRLRVEMWMYERLHELYGAVNQQLNLYIGLRKTKASFPDQEDIEIDLDEVLDIDSDIERRVFLNVSLTVESK